MNDGRTQWTNGRLDDKLRSHDEELRDIRQNLRDARNVSAELATLREAVQGMRDRMDRFRADVKDDFGVVHSDIKTVSRATISLLAAMVVAMVGVIAILL